MGKKLRLSKSHAESLSRALNDQSRHALGGGGHATGAAAPPPLPPPPQQLLDAQAHYHILSLLTQPLHNTHRYALYAYSSTQRYACVYVPQYIRATYLMMPWDIPLWYCAHTGADGLWLPAVAQPREPLLVNRERKRVHHPPARRAAQPACELSVLCDSRSNGSVLGVDRVDRV